VAIPAAHVGQTRNWSAHTCEGARSSHVSEKSFIEQVSVQGVAGIT
jgi:hypothetical protein